jgi:hypothetical protein
MCAGSKQTQVRPPQAMLALQTELCRCSLRGHCCASVCSRATARIHDRREPIQCLSKTGSRSWRGKRRSVPQKTAEHTSSVKCQKSTLESVSLRETHVCRVGDEQIESGRSVCRCVRCMSRGKHHGTPAKSTAGLFSNLSLRRRIPRGG